MEKCANAKQLSDLTFLRLKNMFAKRRERRDR